MSLEAVVDGGVLSGVVVSDGPGLSDEFQVTDGNLVASDVFPVRVGGEMLFENSVDLGYSVEDCLDLFSSRLGCPPGSKNSSGA